MRVVAGVPVGGEAVRGQLAFHGQRALELLRHELEGVGLQGVPVGQEDDLHGLRLADPPRAARGLPHHVHAVVGLVPAHRLELHEVEAGLHEPGVADEPVDAVVRHIFEMALAGRSVLDISKALDGEGIPSPAGKRWNKTTIHQMLSNETYTGTLLWGVTAKDGLPPVRVEGACPAIVSKDEFRQVATLLRAKAPTQVHPRHSGSPYLLSGLVRCRKCRRALTAAEAKSGKYNYYVCQSLLKRGSGTCETPRLNAKRFERLIVEQIREHILTESNIRDLVRLVDEELDGVAREERAKLESIKAELPEVRRKMDRLWHAVETSDLKVNDILPRLRLHQENQERLEAAAEGARASLAERRAVLDSAEVIAAFAREMSEFLRTSELTESKAFIRSFVKEIAVQPGTATIRYTIPAPPDSPIGGAGRSRGQVA